MYFIDNPYDRYYCYSIDNDYRFTFDNIDALFTFILKGFHYNILFDGNGKFHEVLTNRFFNAERYMFYDGGKRLINIREYQKFLAYKYLHQEPVLHKTRTSPYYFKFRQTRFRTQENIEVLIIEQVKIISKIEQNLQIKNLKNIIERKEKEMTGKKMCGDRKEVGKNKENLNTSIKKKLKK